MSENVQAVLYVEKRQTQILTVSVKSFSLYLADLFIPITFQKDECEKWGRVTSYRYTLHLLQYLTSQSKITLIK